MRSPQDYNYDRTRTPPNVIPATTARTVFMWAASTAEVYVSGGPRTPPGADWPGYGAPSEPKPPPSTSVGAVGNGPVDVELEEDEDELELAGADDACVGVTVMLRTMPEVMVLGTRPEARVMKVVKEVVWMTEGWVFAGCVELPEGATVPEAGLCAGTDEVLCAGGELVDCAATRRGSNSERMSTSGLMMVV